MSPNPNTDTSDFYAFEQMLSDSERALLHSVHDFSDHRGRPDHQHTLECRNLPVRDRARTPEARHRRCALPGLRLCRAELPARRMIAMELARTDSSIATFNGVHGGLAMGSIYLCGSDEQRERFLPSMAQYEKIGSFGLTEPDVGSGASGGLTTTAERDGDTWTLNGQKKWIGNATFGDLTVIWPRTSPTAR